MRFGYATIRCILFFVMVISIVDSFQARRNHPKERRCEMAKGFNKARNKQAELAKKMQLAKKEKQKENPILKAEESVEENNDQGDVAANTMDVDRQMFQRLLDSTKGAIPTDSDTDSAFITEIRVGPKKVKKKKMSPDPKEKEVEKDTKEEIRVAQRIHFESLIDIESSKKLGNIGAAKLVPWVPPYLNECLVVFADPRTNSVELRQTIKYLASACPKIEDKDDEKNPSKPKIIDQVIFVTADSVPEIQAWLKRSRLSSPIRIFSDPQLGWMSEYGVLSGEKDDEKGTFPWSMAMLTFDTNGDLIEQNRKVKPSHSTQLVLDTIKNMSEKS